MADAAKSVVSERGGEAAQELQPDLSKVSARKNLNETAFFFPHLLADANGAVKIEFTMPEALTEWKFMGFAHDRELRSGFLTDKVVTAKDLMVEPNPPRFVREGDTIEFTVKVSNQTATQQTGRVKLTFTDARTLQPVDAELANNLGEQSFDLPPRESRSFAWRLTVPDGMDFLAYKAVGATDRLADGEEGYLPVLSRRILVSESTSTARAWQADEEVCLHETCRIRQITDVAAPEPDRADGFAARLVRGDGAAVPDGVPVRVHRTDVQPPLRQRAQPATSPTPTRRSAGSSTFGKTRPPSTARSKRTRT